jgi:hypothetical protein
MSDEDVQLFKEEAEFGDETVDSLISQGDVGAKSLLVRGGTNSFGGKNPNSEYVPMSEHEQEAIDRLVTTENLEIRIPGWGTLKNPRVKFGDLRVAIYVRLNLNNLPTFRRVSFLNLELWTQSGILLFSDKQKTQDQRGRPILIEPGMEFSFIWDIALHSMDPALVKLLTGAKGLTSRRQDRDTGAITTDGNMKLSTGQKKKLRTLEQLAETLKT